MKSARIIKRLAQLVVIGTCLAVPTTATLAQTQKRAVTAKKSIKPVRAKMPVKPAPQEPGSFGPLKIQSNAFFVLDQSSGDVVLEKNAGAVQPIASITKVMTAMVALDALPNLQEKLTISNEDVDLLKGTGSRLRVGVELTREEMLRLALMSSENRAASALSRHYPGGKDAFVAAMNAKAAMLGLSDTRFKDPTGLTAENVSSPRDLARMVEAAYQYPLIREFSTTAGDKFLIGGREMQFNNTNSLVKSPNWEIGLSKTGYISEAGKCLVMQAWLNSKPMIIVLLDSWGKATRIGDANRIKRLLEEAGDKLTAARQASARNG
jgi:D-alanyl-D-alanine endopeptidase (penicillin-binding protein 7)